MQINRSLRKIKYPDKDKSQVVVWEFLPHKQHMPKHLPTQCLAVAERSRALGGARDTGKSERSSGKGDWPARLPHIL